LGDWAPSRPVTICFVLFWFGLFMLDNFNWKAKLNSWMF
jgi:hypothetical protein